jgi:hypothetical protein
MAEPQRLADLQSRLTAALRDLPGATALYLYGSAADPARRDAYSDLDLQVLTVDFQASKDHLLSTLEKAGVVTLAYLLTDTAHETAYSLAFAGESPYHKVDLGITCLNDPAHPPTFFEQIRHKELLWSQSPPPLESLLQDGKTLHRQDAKDAKKDKSKRECVVFRNKISFSSSPSSSLRSLRLCGAKYGSACNTLLEGRVGERFLHELHRTIRGSIEQPYFPAKDSPAYFLVGEILSAFRYAKARRRGHHLVCWRFLAAKVNALLALIWWQHNGGRIPEKLNTWELAELDAVLPESARMDMLQVVDCRQPAQMDQALLEITRRIIVLLRPRLGEPDQQAVWLAEEGLEFMIRELK